MQGKIWGASVDFSPAFRDLFLAGGFTSAVMYASSLEPIFLMYGFISGAMLGLVLHVLPPEPAADDNKMGRIGLRAVSGAIAGMCMAPGLAWMLTGAALGLEEMPATSTLVKAGIYGLIAGCAWYIAWGFWETRKLGKTVTA